MSFRNRASARGAAVSAVHSRVESLESRTMMAIDLNHYALTLYQLDANGTDFSQTNSIVAGTRVFPQIAYINNSFEGFASPLTAKVYLSTDDTLDANDTVLASGTDTSHVNSALAPHAISAFFGQDIAFTVPTSLADGHYFVFSEIDPGAVPGQGGGPIAETDETNNIQSTFIDVSHDNTGGGGVDIGAVADALQPQITIGSKFLKDVLAGKDATVKLTITNPSDTAISARVRGNVIASSDPNQTSDDLTLGTLPEQDFSIGAGERKSFDVTVSLAPDAPEGLYTLTASVEIINPADSQVLRTLTASTTAPVPIPATRTALTDADGTVTKISISGGGTGGLLVNDVTGLIDLVLDGTTATSKIKLKTKGGDGVTSINDVLITGSVNKIDGKKVDLLGNVSISGGVKSLTLNNVADGHQITIGAGVTPVSLKFANVAETSITSGSAIKSLRANSWTDADGIADVITAPSIGKLTIKGAFDADLNLSGVGVAPGKKTLGKAKISGAIGPDTWTIIGDVKQLSAGSITAGWTATVTGIFSSLKVTADASGSLTTFDLKKISVKGVNGLLVTETSTSL
jgi:hypothetical protein